MFRKIFTVVFLWTSFVNAESSCPAWSDLKSKIEDLKKILVCGSQFTAQECQENLEYLKGAAIGIVTTGGAALGARAGRNIELKAPKVCGLFSRQSFWFESVAFAGCQSQVTMGADSIKDVLRNSQSIREAEMGTMLTEKLAKAEPKLDALSADVMRTFSENGTDLTTKLKSLNEKLETLGIKITSLGQCTGPKEICDKIWSLAYAKSPFDVKQKIAGNADRLAKYYALDPDVQKFNLNREASQDLIRRIESGRIKTESELAQLFFETKKSIHPSMSGLLADTADKIIARIPAMKNTTLAEGASLRTLCSKYLGANAARLKKVLPFGLASLIGVAGGANASEIVEGFIPLGLSPTNLGCAERFSKYAPPTDENCKPNSTELTDLMKDFLSLDEAAQMKEICSHPSLQGNLQNLHRRYFQSVELVCASDSFSVKKQSRPGDFFANYKFTEDKIQSANISTREIDGLTGYRLQFDNEGVVQTGQLVRSRGATNITRGSSAESTAAVGEDFAAKQVFAYAGKECCADRDSSSCSQFKVSGAGDGGASSDGAQ